MAEEINVSVDNTDVSANAENAVNTETQKVEIVTPQMQRLLSEIDELKKKSANIDDIAAKAAKIEKIEKAIKGEDNADDDFYKNLTVNPKEAIEKLVEERTKPLLDERQKEKLLTSDERNFARLSTEDSDFPVLWANVNKYVSPEEMASVENNPQRVEIIYGLAKSRKLIQEVKTKESAKEVDRKAKEELSQTTATERPSSGSGASIKEEPQDERVNVLKEAREKFDTKTATKTGTDILWDLTQWGKRFKK